MTPKTTRTITGTVGAWLTNDAYGPQDLAGADTGHVLSVVVGYSNADMTSYGWARIGEATITVAIPDERTLVENKIEALRAAQKRELADAHARAIKIEQQIQTLLAITYDRSAE